MNTIISIVLAIFMSLSTTEMLLKTPEVATVTDFFADARLCAEQERYSVR